MTRSRDFRWIQFCTQRFGIGSALTFLVTLVFAFSVELTVAQDEKPKKETLAQLIERRKGDSHTRFCGAQLTIKARFGKDNGFSQEVLIDWSITYNGPRPPFAIFMPTFEYPSNGETRLYVYYSGQNGEGRETFVESPAPDVGFPYSKNHFAISKDGKPVSGEVNIKFGQVEQDPWRLRRPQAFEKNVKVYVQLSHAPTQRGEADLDAWTGHLMSNVVEVKRE